MTDTIEQLEQQLDDFDIAVRNSALEDLIELAETGEVILPEPRPFVNLHAHSFYSYNARGYSPSRIAWQARKEGLAVVGLVDFDVFDGIDEFHEAGRMVGIKTVAGMETRAYIPEFADREINSPGEPGITYHMGIALTQSGIEDPWARQFARMLRDNAGSRNRAVMEAVNGHLDPVRLDYETHVLPLSPSGTPTERHLCEAYQLAAEERFPDASDRARFWAEKLQTPVDTIQPILNDPAALQGLLRKKTMKRGGVGYQQPTEETFPLMSDVNRFVLAVGGIPTLTWLDGTSAGEQAIEELADLQAKTGVAAMNIIPDRNWNIDDADTRATKVRNLYDVVAMAEKRGWPIAVGTEMNAPGLKFVDDFDAPELQPVVELFLRGAYVLFGATMAQMKDQRGYLSEWAKNEFKSVEAKNDYFEQIGRQPIM